MKLKINIHSLVITEVSENLSVIPGIKNNGQRFQLPDHVLADVVLKGEVSQFTLWHPQTQASTGHFDVSVQYSGHRQPSFHQYSSFQLIPVRDLRQAHPIWPTGGAHLVSVVFAIETFLQQKIGFEPALQKHVLMSIQQVPGTPPQPGEFPEETVIKVKLVEGPGIYNGSGSLSEQTFDAVVGPIHDSGLEFWRWAFVKNGQGAGGFEQWLKAVWRNELSVWTIDHPNC